MAQEISIPVSPEHLLEALQQRLPLPVHLSLHVLESDSEDKFSLPETLKSPLPEISNEEEWKHSLYEAIFRGIEKQSPAIFRYPEGMLNFVAPFWDERNKVCCILGTGVREVFAGEPLPKSKKSPKKSGTGEEAFHEANKNLPSARLEDIEVSAEITHKYLQSVLKKNPYVQTLEKVTRQLRTLSDLTAEIEQCQNTEQVSVLVAETLVVLFDLAAVTVVVSDKLGNSFLLEKTLGNGPDQINAEAVRKFIEDNPPGKVVALSDTRSIFPGEKKKPGLCLSLTDGETSLGLLALFGGAFISRDHLLVELLAAKMASRLGRLAWEEQFLGEMWQNERLVEIICSLASVKTRRDLFHQIVDLATDLLGATRGSLMLVEESGEHLDVVASMGMSESLAKNMKVRFGSGIAGRVAVNGTPLLVANIEKDQRIASSNRPRFKTKSFVSVPLRSEEHTIGVLNLADKEREETFSQADLDLLIRFSNLVVPMVERANIFENAVHMEELAITDPLTGIYNRRFLAKRLEEELSRSSRQKLEFTIMLLDLDHFKHYNDLVGHLGGDRALQKTAELLRNSAREMDIVTRYGGEEFCVLLPGTSKRESSFVADRIRRGIENEPFPEEKKLPSGNLTVSIGVATFPKDGETAEILLQSADRALYHAKETGRNRIVLSESPKTEKFNLSPG